MMIQLAILISLCCFVLLSTSPRVYNTLIVRPWNYLIDSAVALLSLYIVFCELRRRAAAEREGLR